MTVEEITRAWEEGLSGPLRTARHTISHLLDNMEQRVVSRPLVIVTGGTARNHAVKSHMAALCREGGVPVVFTDELNFRTTHLSVAPSSSILNRLLHGNIRSNLNLFIQLGSGSDRGSFRRQQNPYRRAVLPTRGRDRIANTAASREGPTEDGL